MARMRARVGRVAGVLGVVGLAGSAVVLPACVKNEATGRSIFTLGMSKQQQMALGAEAAPQFVQEMGGPVPDPRLQSYVDRIGRALAAQTEGDNKNWAWEFNYINTAQVNAFALPGGKVFFTRGLAERLTTEAQMAGVIGHEIGHVTAEHGAQRIASSTAIGGGIQAAAVLVGVSGSAAAQQAGQVLIPGLNVGGQLVLLKFGRKEELEADALGVRYMTRAGYNPKGQMEVMQVLAQLSKGPSQPEFLSTHPDPQARVEAIRQMLAGEYAYTQNEPAKYQEFAERYKTEFLAVSKALPPAPKAAQASITLTREQLAAAGVDPSEFDLNDPTSWCAHCRIAAVEQAGQGEGASARGGAHDGHALGVGAASSARAMLAGAALARTPR